MKTYEWLVGTQGKTIKVEHEPGKEPNRMQKEHAIRKACADGVISSEELRIILSSLDE